MIMNGSLNWETLISRIDKELQRGTGSDVCYIRGHGIKIESYLIRERGDLLKGHLKMWWTTLENNVIQYLQLKKAYPPVFFVICTCPFDLSMVMARYRFSSE